LIPALVVLAGAYSNNHPKIKEITIELPKKQSTLRELIVVFASDLYLGRADFDVLNRFVTQRNGLEPDSNSAIRVFLDDVPYFLP
jgi:uncharacterized protein